MRSAVALASVVLAACSFTPGTLPGDAAAVGDTSSSDGMTDARLGDAAPGDAASDSFVPTQCPADYDLVNPAEPQSRYRLVTSAANWPFAEGDCENDQEPTTQPAHLIVLDDDAERIWAYEQDTSDKWVGMTDRANEAEFLAVTAQTSPYVGNAASDDDQKDCMFVNQNETVVERCLTQTFDYLCECDGLAANPQRYTPP